MYCPSCGTEVKTDYNVCPKCGCVLNKAQMQSVQENSQSQPYQTPSVMVNTKQRADKRNKKNKILIIVIASVIVLGAGIAALIYFISEGNKKALLEAEKQAKADDITAAGSINNAIMVTLANEGAFDDIMSLSKGEIIAVAKAGEPFVSATKAPMDHFLAELQKNLGNAPVLNYTGTINGWTPAGWAIEIDSDWKEIVYITDGSVNHKVEIYPHVDVNYQ